MVSASCWRGWRTWAPCKRRARLFILLTEECCSAMQINCRLVCSRVLFVHMSVHAPLVQGMARHVGQKGFVRMPQAEVSAGGEGAWHLAWLRATNLMTGAVSMLPVDRHAWPHARMPSKPFAKMPGLQKDHCTAL